MNKLIEYKQTGYGTYRVTIEDANGERHTTHTNEVDAIDAIRQAGRDLKSNDDGSYEQLRNEFADNIAAIIGLEN